MTDAHDNAEPVAQAGQEPLLAVLQDARRRIEQYQKERDERIAVVGMSGRFPGADDIGRFWALLDAGRSGLSEVGEEALAAAGVPAEQSAHADYVRVWGGFNDPSGFDAAFFGYSPREAELLDPQQRVFLECAWGALEHAGYDSRRFPGCIGVYGGGALTGYLLHSQGHRALRERTDPLQLALSNVNGLVPARVSYHLDLRGPSCGVQTTCSTSLVAVHTAARSLLAGECDMALAGGVAVGQARAAGYLYQREGIASPDGTCRPFDGAAQGTVFTNGVGIVVLKRLSDALAAGDTVYGVILGSAVNNDGAGKVGIAAPSVSGQAAVLEAALKAARIDPASIDYVEAHGTGTALGDPIEVAALNRAYGPAFRAAGRQCALGAVKGNIGHLDAAAGVAGLIKILLALRHGKLPATVHFTAPNPACDFAGGPFRVLGEPRGWERNAAKPRRAGISSFGIGGTNAHVIVEEAPETPARGGEAEEASHLLPLSARTPEALARADDALTRLLDSPARAPLADIAYTLQVGRRPMKERSIRLFHPSGGASDVVTGTALSDRPGVVFLFTGQGAQHVGMGRSLYAREPVFREAFDACAAAMPDGLDLAALLWPSAGADADLLNRTEITQPALFAVEYTLAQLWLSRGIAPQAMLGHSIGEYVAACVAGVFSLADAVRVVCARGRLMQRCQPGAMLSVMLSEAEAGMYLPEGVEVAAVNAPRSCVLAGPVDAIRDLADLFDRRAIGSRLLKTSHAFHTAMMEPALGEFAEVMAGVALNPPAIDIASNVTGDWLTAAEATDPFYWVRHVRQTVKFASCLGKVLELATPILLEVGPGSTLTRLARQQLHDNARAIASLPDAGSGHDDAEHALLALGQLWLAGLDIDWERLHASGTRRRVGLPTYPFERTSYWIPPAALSDTEDAAPERSDTLADWFYQPVWRRRPLEAPREQGAARWLMLGGGPLASALGNLPPGIDAVWVDAASIFSGGGGYTLDPLNKDHYRNLLTDLAATGWTPDQIVNGFGLDAGISPPPHGPGMLYESTLALARGLAAYLDKPPLLTLVGRGMQQVTGAETLEPGAAMALGLAKVLPQELPGLRCRAIDVAAGDVSGHRHVRGLSEAIARPWAEAEAEGALRGGFHWLQSYSAAPMPEPAEVPALKPGATYLVAGDLVDGLGLVYAAALVEKLGAKVILVGRAGLPAPKEWDRWLASHSPNHDISQMIRTLRAMGENGRDYMLFSGPLGDAEWMAAALAEGEGKLGPIQGVFYTAGMGHHYYRPIAETTPNAADSLFEAKLSGIQALEQALGSRKPAFVLIQSSLSTLVGGQGFAAYAAANSFLDAFASARSEAAGTAWQAIGWDACQTHATTESGGSALLADAMNPDEVWRATRAVLAQPGVTRVAATPGNLRRRLAAAGKPASSAEAAPAIRPGRRGSAPYVAPDGAYQIAVASAMGELLGIERVGANDNFFELGGHSLLAIQVITRLRQQFDVELPIRALLFEAPTVAGIAQVIGQAVEASAAERETLASLIDDIEAEAATQPQPTRKQA
jgi:phthiocerol/phenolphthiocerol synthesis type-I polyketide synthase E